jgi:hypothetical protein
MIKEGYEQGINSYGGKLGKLRWQLILILQMMLKKY